METFKIYLHRGLDEPYLWLIVQLIFRFDLFVVSLSEINECESNPCLNSGRCMDLVDNYTCVCVAPFTGQRCETGALIS